MAAPGRTPNLPSPILVISCDTSGLELEDSPISIAAALVESAPDEDWREVARWHGLQEAPGPISEKASQIHGLAARDLEGKSFDLAQLRDMLGKAVALVAWNPRFTAKMLAKVMPEVLEKPWFEFERHTGHVAPAVAGANRASTLVEEILSSMGIRGGSTKRSRTWLTTLILRGRMPVHHHVAGNLPITLQCDRPTGTVFTEMLAKCKVGTTFNLWSKSGMDFIGGYANGYVFGEGLCFQLPVAGNEDLVEMIQQKAKYIVSAELTDVRGFEYSIAVRVHTFGSASPA